MLTWEDDLELHALRKRGWTITAIANHAKLDRLLHRSIVINLDGESYRLRDHHAAAETLRRTTTGNRQPLR